MNILRIIALVSMTTTFAIVGLAQTPPPPPPPPPANDYSPKLWKEYVFEEAKFIISLPGKPKESSGEGETPLGKVKIFTASYQSFLSYSAGVTEYTKSKEDTATAKGFLDKVQEAGLASVARVEPKIISQKEISLDGHPGRYIEVRLSNTHLLRLKWIVVDKRLYFVSFTAPLDESGMTMASKNGYEELAMSFLNSFKLVK